MHISSRLSVLLGLLMLCGTAAAQHPMVEARKELFAARQAEARHGQIREARIQGRSEKLRYQVIDGAAMLGGDMMLGDAEFVRQHGMPDFRHLLNHRSREALKAREAQIAASNVSLAAPTGSASNGVTRAVSRWPNNVLYYVIDASMNAKGRQAITDGLAMISGRSAIRFVPRTAESNYVNFTAGSGCWSYVGMIGGKQDISLGSGCEYSFVVAHEVMHALGWQHEHQRSDRDQHLTINVANISSGMEYNFDKLPATSADAFGAYDFASIMHYDAYAFSSNGQPTMVPVSSSVGLNSFGNSTNLSTGDIAALNHYYPGSSSSSSSSSSVSSSAASSRAASSSSRASSAAAASSAASSRASSASSASSVSSSRASSSSRSTSSASSTASQAFVITPANSALTVNLGETGAFAFTLAGTPAELSGSIRYAASISNTTVVGISGLRLANGSSASNKWLTVTPVRRGTSTIRLYATAASGRMSSFAVTLTVR
ncbi:M12 family metallopeptidase [Uliginosibacterium sp. 31-12]|uniref:M12 family metallopeptidase n=1 Tax=Uliginosibacterium sp. 31-12 TaxID=3062781 RepID=UPI0026E25519|nr:M12 family metallopeptidase [Uliginosibacterium sp. 31-12]MDO6386765.1 M12 family metallopeptidase [Uliginosibacterium sp. 31-12]